MMAGGIPRVRRRAGDPGLWKCNRFAVRCCDERLPKARTEHERTALARQIEHTDAEIDRLVYALYGLSEEEIALVEGATA
jgi:hypothetical protein